MKISNRAEKDINKQNKPQTRETKICRALCCSSNKGRLSISSSSSVESDKMATPLEATIGQDGNTTRRLGISSSSSSVESDQQGSLSSLTHYMVQEKLEKMIRETQEATHQEKIRKQNMRRRRRRRSGGSMSSTKFIVMMAMEKRSYDPEEDFRDSMIEMIVANKIKEAAELRSLLEYYLSMNTRENRSVILQIFYEVCADLFRS